MKKVFLSLGSNIDAEKNIKSAVAALEKKYGTLAISKVYESEAVGFKGENFLNLVVAFDCDKEVADLLKELKILENDLGRVRGGPKFSSRCIDMDIILFGDLCGEFAGIQIPRYEIYENAYVLLPLKELAPDLIDPASGLSMRDLWNKHSEKMQDQKLWEADFQF